MKSLILISILFICCSCISAEEDGLLDELEHCDPSPSQTDPTLKCDTSKRLSCDVNSRRCRCHHEDRDVYNSKEKRCETKVGKFCDKNDQTFPVICVNQAVCNHSTKFCECPFTDEGNDCSGGQQESYSIFLSSMAMFLLLISVFICT